MIYHAVPIRVLSEVWEGRKENRCRHQPHAETRTGTYLQPALWQDLEDFLIRGCEAPAILQATEAPFLFMQIQT